MDPVSNSFKTDVIVNVVASGANSVMPRGVCCSVTGQVQGRISAACEICPVPAPAANSETTARNCIAWMFRIAHNLWFDRKPAKKIRSEPKDIDQPLGSDARAIRESRLVLSDLLTALDQLSPEHRAAVGRYPKFLRRNAEAQSAEARAFV
jgi:hypothetical protein